MFIARRRSSFLSTGVLLEGRFRLGMDVITVHIAGLRRLGASTLKDEVSGFRRLGSFGSPRLQSNGVSKHGHTTSETTCRKVLVRICTHVGTSEKPPAA